MIKKIPILFLIISALAMAADRGPEKVEIDVNHANLAVKAFPHHLHQEMQSLKGKCTFCHHDAQSGQKPKKCGSCHKLVKKKDPETGAIGFKKAFHKKCLTCHKAKKDEPRLGKCITCHPKK